MKEKRSSHQSRKDKLFRKPSKQSSINLKNVKDEEKKDEERLASRGFGQGAAAEMRGNST